MPKSSSHNAFLPPQAQQALQALREWAQRMGVSVRTVLRMQAGVSAADIDSLSQTIRSNQPL